MVLPLNQARVLLCVRICLAAGTIKLLPDPVTGRYAPLTNCTWVISTPATPFMRVRRRRPRADGMQAPSLVFLHLPDLPIAAGALRIALGHPRCTLARVVHA